MKKIIASALVMLSLATASSASAFSKDFFDATEPNATSTFQGALIVDRTFSLGGPASLADNLDVFGPAAFHQQTAFSDDISVTGPQVANQNGVMFLQNGTVNTSPNFFYNPVDGTFGVGTSSVAAGSAIKFPFVIETTTNGGGLGVFNYNASGPAIPRLGTFAARGTKTAPTQILANDVYGRVVFDGHDGVGFHGTAAASINVFAQENFTPTARGSGLSFATMSLGTTNLTERLRLTATGQTITTGQVVVATTSGAGAFSAFKLVVSGDQIILGSLKSITSETNKLTLDSASDSTGSCIVMKDSDGSGFTYITANDGVLTASTTPCN